MILYSMCDCIQMGFNQLCNASVGCVQEWNMPTKYRTQIMGEYDTSGLNMGVPLNV